MVYFYELHPVRLQHAFGLVPAGGYGKCSSFVCTDSKAEIGPKLATHEGLVMHCTSFYFHAISVLAF